MLGFRFESVWTQFYIRWCLGPLDFKLTCVHLPCWSCDCADRDLNGRWSGKGCSYDTDKCGTWWWWQNQKNRFALFSLSLSLSLKIKFLQQCISFSSFHNLDDLFKICRKCTLWAWLSATMSSFFSYIIVIDFPDESWCHANLK